MKMNVQKNEPLKTIGNRIRNLRITQGLSQTQLADSTGMSPRYLGEIEAGKRNLSFACLNTLTQRLSISLSDLLDFDEPPVREVVLQDINVFLDKLPLRQLLFFQRMIHLFAKNI